MESKYIKVKAKKVEETIDFYASFGWVVSGEREELPHGKVGITFERDKKRLEESYHTVKKGERIYHQISRPYPLAALISLAIACTFLVLYFVLRSAFKYYIIFLYFSLGFFALTVFLLIVFLIIFIEKRRLLDKLVYNVALEAGTLRDYPLDNNVLEEDENGDTWVIDQNFEL